MSTAVREIVCLLITKSGYTRVWVLVGDGLPAGCGHTATLQEKAATVELRSTSLREFSNRIPWRFCSILQKVSQQKFYSTPVREGLLPKQFQEIYLGRVIQESDCLWQLPNEQAQGFYRASWGKVFHWEEFQWGNSSDLNSPDGIWTCASSNHLYFVLWDWLVFLLRDWLVSCSDGQGHICPGFRAKMCFFQWPFVTFWLEFQDQDRFLWVALSPYTMSMQLKNILHYILPSRDIHKTKIFDVMM